MIKYILFLLFILSNILYAKVNVVVSVLPQKVFVEAIGGDKVNVALMVKPGSSPHTYEPKPSQMKDISKANIYFSIGVEFEKVWLLRFANQNVDMKIIDIGNNIIKMKNDPHIWVSPSNVKIIARNIYNNLVEIDKENKDYYKSNLNKFLLFVSNTDLKIKEILKNTKKDTKFMVFHPAWGYFARDYNLVQLPIEIDGKSPKPKALIHLISEAKQHGVKAIFTQPEFSPKVANQIAKQLGIKVIKATPLNPNWNKNLINLAKAIATNE